MYFALEPLLVSREALSLTMPPLGASRLSFAKGVSDFRISRLLLYMTRSQETELASIS